MSTQHDYSDLPDEVREYIERVAKGIPGGAECPICHQVNTFEHVSIRVYKKASGLYVFNQRVWCRECGAFKTFRWHQKIEGKNDGNDESPC